MKLILLLLFLFTTPAFGQKISKKDKVILNNLKTTISYLADDKLEGRRTGTNGEKLAYEYLSNDFKEIGLLPKGDDGTYLQKFTVDEGKEILPTTVLSINGNPAKLNEGYFPLIMSANGSVNSYTSASIHESGAPWILDLKEMMEDNKENPHFDIIDAIQTKAAADKDRGANALIVYNSGAINDGLAFDGKSKIETSSIPVIYLTKKISDEYLKDKTDNLKVEMRVDIGNKQRTGHNVVGYIDNNAPNTIVIGGHFDHLGYGQDHNSLWTGAPQIHNGADDNASGTAAVIELARILKDSKLTNNNYLFACFSGEELGLYGSKSFVNHPDISALNLNYMINMDMVGRLNDSTKKITIGGYGTSPEWGKILSPETKAFTAVFDSSGIGPSDHTSFYLKDIPVLFFFTGTHADYHKPSDDVDKINFNGTLAIVKYIHNIIEKTNNEGKLVFTKTREPQMGNGAKFTVSLGVMPDYTYSGTGLHVDGIIDGRAADKAGMKTGDVIIAIGDYKVTEINSYMTALSKFKKGDPAKVLVKRGDDELSFDIIF
ncbi:MAG: M20/M25/M40 family metallo-hydrolase [Ginsengibacter sp.]